jgi:hypothetical protein
MRRSGRIANEEFRLPCREVRRLNYTTVIAKQIPS